MTVDDLIEALQEFKEENSGRDFDYGQLELVREFQDNGGYGPMYSAHVGASFESLCAC